MVDAKDDQAGPAFDDEDEDELYDADEEDFAADDEFGREITEVRLRPSPIATFQLPEMDAAFRALTMPPGPPSNDLGDEDELDRLLADLYPKRD